MNKVKLPDSYMIGYDGLAEDWISTSALALLQMCGMAFYYKYIKREPEPINIRMAAGTGAHKGREVNLTHKLESGGVMTEGEVQDAARDNVVESFDKSEYSPTTEFEGKSKEHARDISKDMAVEFVVSDYSAFQLDVNPLAVEKSIAVKYDNIKRVLVGKIDLVEEDYIVDDLKTSKAAYGQAKADKSMAFATYGLLTYLEYGVLPPKYRIHNISRGKTGCRPHLYETTRTMEDIDRQLLRFVAGCNAIEAGNFIPCNSEHWKCGPDYCGFYKQCPYGAGKIGG